MFPAAIHSWSTGSRLFRRCAVAMDDLRRLEESRVARIIFDGGRKKACLSLHLAQTSTGWRRPRYRFTETSKRRMRTCSYGVAT